MEETLKSLSQDYLSLLTNGQGFSDVTFSVEGRLVHAHRCILAARSVFFRKLFFSGSADELGSTTSFLRSPDARSTPTVILVNSISYEVFLRLLQFLYCGQVSIAPQKHELRPSCRESGCWHTHCAAAVDLALHTLAAACCFGVDQLVLLCQKQLGSIVENASMENVMKVLLASHKQELHQLWEACSHIVAKSGLSPELLAKHLPFDVVSKIEEVRHNSGFALRSPFSVDHRQQHRLGIDNGGGASVSGEVDVDRHHKIGRMRRALESSDVELVKLMATAEGLDLDEAQALHFAVENCSREVVKALLEIGATDVNYSAGRVDGKTPLHVAAEMVNPDMVAVLLDHHADPRIQRGDGFTPLQILRNVTSEILFKGAGLPGLTHVEPNKLRLCLELVQSAVTVMSREEESKLATATAGSASGAMIAYPAVISESSRSGTTCECEPSVAGMMCLSLDSRMMYLN